MLKHKLDYDTIKEIVKEAVEIETEFITESLPCNLIGMNSQILFLRNFQVMPSLCL